MNEIITTFETTLTFYSISDLLPKHFDDVLFYSKKGFLYSGTYFNFKGYKERYFTPNDSNIGIFIDEIKWWSYLPELE